MLKKQIVDGHSEVNNISKRSGASISLDKQQIDKQNITFIIK